MAGILPVIRARCTGASSELENIQQRCIASAKIRPDTQLTNKLTFGFRRCSVNHNGTIKAQLFSRRPADLRYMCCRRGLLRLFHSFSLKYGNALAGRAGGPAAANHVPFKVRGEFYLSPARTAQRERSSSRLFASAPLKCASEATPTTEPIH